MVCNCILLAWVRNEPCLGWFRLGLSFRHLKTWPLDLRSSLMANCTWPGSMLPKSRHDNWSLTQARYLCHYFIFLCTVCVRALSMPYMGIMAIHAQQI